MTVEMTTPLYDAGVRVRVLYRCHHCSQGSHLVEVPASEYPGVFRTLVAQAVRHHHADMSPGCPRTKFQVRFVDPGPL